MEKKDLIAHSPVRYFDATNAALKDGEMGLVTAKKGLGKTSILVQFGIDSLLNDKALVHVSFDQQSSNVIAWYSSVMAEIAKKKSFNLDEVNEEIVRNRTILNFNQETFTLPKVVNTLKALKDGGIKIASIVVDGLDLAKVADADLKCFADFVKAEKMTAWFSFTSEASDLKGTLDAAKLDAFATVAHLANEGNALSLALLKNGSGKVNLDAKTLLMCK
jgi:KaiC/GvpD/RAD55 family RecA-like ATPase